ncbi:MAG TPA: SDR family NAD(P)-dependent oxidoreductase, partial [Acidimicrobiales bacterium]|nr:SDR family NAD(P)-dependent oxidoreductase [Acidimicrobiales bacterium]
AYRRERPEALVKAVDFTAAAGPAEIAAALVEETRLDPGAVEVGRADGQRWTVALEERPAADGGAGLSLGPGSVIVVTGAAGSIVSAVVADLAAASGATFHLLDLSPEPDPDDADLGRLAGDRDGLKADLVGRLKASGTRPTPVLVERELARIERLAAARAAIDAVRGAGGTAQYHAVDLTDGEAVEAVVRSVVAEHGRVDVLVHAAGLEISRRLPDKEPAEFDLVFGVKADGWFNIVRALGDAPLGATVVFSSIAGRFGNSGQTDYSAANDLLCKLTSALRTTRPATRGIAVDWTAWGGIGMASRGSIPRIMEAAGIDMLAPEAGIPTVRRELVAGATRGEVVVAGRLGVMAGEPDEETGGIDPAAAPTAAGTMVGRVARMAVQGGLTVEVTLDPARLPFLDDHRIDGTPVLPGVMSVEAMAEAARLPLEGWHVVEVDDVEFLAPCKFYRDEPRTLTVTAEHRPESGGGMVARCRLTSTRLLPGQAEPQVTVHVTGTVRLARRVAEPARSEPPPGIDGAVPAEAGAIYAVYFHGPAYRVLRRSWRAGDTMVGLLADDLPADHDPAGDAATGDVTPPRLVELCFQTAGVWEIGREGRMGLPRGVRRIAVAEVPPGPAPAPVHAVVTPAADGSFDARVVDGQGTVLVEIEGYRTVELPGGVDARRRAALQRAVG